ncbi:hypothetical protein RhiirA4_479652 [Rhizophagus irregularis]|uniref:RNase H type-1 domain-containing protein n=1 Tax=Rhizophagus irregularis TaxID=588596 RepID=A0A2I1HGS0_9GLOM|nr:hypothetical protein RhiirA4_479652 [Rhizophagus irregularis]
MSREATLFILILYFLILIKLCLSETVGYPTRNAKVFAAYLPITLSTTWSYATSLALHFLDGSLPTPLVNLPISDIGYDVVPSILPSSTCSLYTDGSFHRATDDSPPSMACAWLALDDDGFILESSSSSLLSCFPSALRSEISAVLLGLKALSPGSSVTIATDCAQLISLWSQFVDAPFSPKLLRQHNHLLWLSIRYVLENLHLRVKLIKVPAHGDDALNVRADTLAQAAHLSLQPTFSPKALCQVPCLLTFNSLPIDMNVRHFLRSIGDARNFLSFCSLARFTALGSPALFDWAELNPCLTHRKEVIKFRDDCITAFSSSKNLPDLFSDGFSALNCWDYNTPSASCLWLTRGLLPAHLTDFLKEYFPLSIIYKVISPLLNDFQLELYGEIWLCRNVLFHAWEESQGILPSSKSKTKGDPTPISSIISSHHHNSSLASVPQDSWISWISSSIIRGGSWISHLDFLRRLTVQPLRISFW